MGCGWLFLVAFGCCWLLLVVVDYCWLFLIVAVIVCASSGRLLRLVVVAITVMVAVVCI